MIRDASGHGRRRHTSVAETRVRYAEVIHRPDQRHPVLPGQCVTHQRPASTGQWGQALPEWRVQPRDVRRVDHPGALQAAPERLDACRCAIHKVAF